MKLTIWTTLVSAILAAQSASAATVYDINWTMGAVDNIEIQVGDTVRWTWGGGFHSVKYFSGPVPFATSAVSSQAGFSFEQTFMTAGDWQAICGVHGASMSTFISASEVPVPAAAWLFGSALVGLAGMKRKKL